MIAHTYRNMNPTDLESFSSLLKTRITDKPIFESLRLAALSALTPVFSAFTDAKKLCDKHKGTDRTEKREQCRMALIQVLYSI
jgi:hypothetical protein